MIFIYKSVILYSNGCPKCRDLKILLERQNVEFTENNSLDDMLALGFTKVPILCVDGVNMDFNEAKKWVKHITKETENEE